MTQTRQTTAFGDVPPRPPDRSAWRDVLALARNTWRGLTSMRTALILLFLLALAALPGSLLPQRTPSPQAVDNFSTQYPTLAPLLDAVGMFDLFATPWFSAIYLLLFISLIGCLLPRTLEQARGLRAETVATPRNLARLPHHHTAALDADVDAIAAAARRRLRGWRIAMRCEDGGVRTVAAEKGVLREVGNLVFHASLIVLLVGIAVGKLFGYEGNVIVMANGSEFCNSGFFAYDNYRPGLEVDGAGLDPFCLRVEAFRATYLPNGQPASFAADLWYQDGQAIADGAAPQQRTIAVNDPLRLDGQRVYLTGHGYAPQFTVTFPDGQQRTGLVQWEPVDQTTFLSQGATKIDPPDVTDETQRRRGQIAVTGLFAPTASGGSIVTSTYPALNNPEAAVDVYRGDLGLDSGRAQSIFSIDQTMVEQGRLVRIARQNLTPGQSLTLDDGTQVRFDTVKEWVNLQISHDPAQVAVLLASAALLAGITTSLTIKRRRFWVRITPNAPPTTDSRSVSSGCTVAFGGLARSDQAGYGEEFTRLVRDLAEGGAARTEAPRVDGEDTHGR